MKIVLAPEEKASLEFQHRRERDRRIADRIKAVLLTSEGWSQKQISQALRITAETVHDHLKDYIELKKLKPTNGGSQGRLNESQTAELVAHLKTETYTKVSDICIYVQQKYAVEYTVSGMTDWLHNHKFSYKRPKGTPAKANKEEQEAFVKYYGTLMITTPEDEPILFGDGVHPTMATKVTSGWIMKGRENEKQISTTGSRSRMNLMGSINLETMKVTINEYPTIDSVAMEDYFANLRKTYPKAPKIHVILDRGSYNTSAVTKEAAIKYGIALHFLPPYSPNLNPIERLWKVMNEHVRNNRFFKNEKEFVKTIRGFFKVTWPSIALSMTSRINDSFQRI